MNETMFPALGPCCAVNAHGRGHSTTCRQWTPRPSRLRRWLREARAWWTERGLHDDTDPMCRHHWDNTTGGRCRRCKP